MISFHKKRKESVKKDKNHQLDNCKRIKGKLKDKVVVRRKISKNKAVEMRIFSVDLQIRFHK